MTASRSTSPIEQYAFAIKALSDKITALERAYARLPYLTQAEVDARIPIIGDPLFLTPAEGDALFLTQAEGDTRYVNHSEFDGLYLLRAGGTLTGQVISTAGGEVMRFGGATNPHTTWYTGATRRGYIQALDASTAIRIAGDDDLQLWAQGAQKVLLDAAGVKIPANTLFGQQVRGWGNPGLIASGSASAYIGLYPNATDYLTVGTRTGYIGKTGGAETLLIVNESSGEILRLQTTGAGTIDFYPAAAYSARLTGAGFLLGKTASGIANNGVEMFETGTYYATRADNTNNVLLNKLTGVGSGAFYIVFAINGGAIGSITRNAATSAVLFNTTSHGPWKGNVEELDDDEAIERVLKWRPVAYQWKMKDGRTAEDGTPEGEVQHGFIAQEMEQVNPNAVSPQVGTEAEGLAWEAEVAAYQEAEQARAEIEAENERMLADWDQRQERKRDEGIVRHQRQVADFRARVEKGGKPKPPPEFPVFEAIPRPELIPLPELPPKPAEANPFQPAGGDWSQLVPDLSAAVQALIRQNRALTARVDALEAAASN